MSAGRKDLADSFCFRPRPRPARRPYDAPTVDRWIQFTLLVLAIGVAILEVYR